MQTAASGYAILEAAVIVVTCRRKSRRPFHRPSPLARPNMLRWGDERSLSNDRIGTGSRSFRPANRRLSSAAPLRARGDGRGLFGRTDFATAAGCVQDSETRAGERRDLRAP